MPKRNTSNTGDFHDAIQIGTMLRPLIERSVTGLSNDQRRALKQCLIAAERQLADPGAPVGDRIRRARSELEAHGQFGATWRLLLAKIDDYAQGSAAGIHELGAVSLLFGLALEVLAESASAGRKAA